MPIPARPALTAAISLADFEEFYWLKTELNAFCRAHGLPGGGGKRELAARIGRFLQTGPLPPTGQLVNPSPRRAPKLAAGFDWQNAPLHPGTVITANYQNTENVRAFFAALLGPQFKFTVPFMAWLRPHPGRTLAAAGAEWQRQRGLKRDKSQQTAIAPQFEYNQYMRDFLAANPGRSAHEARHFWSLKKQLRGSKAYEQADLQLV